MGEVVGIAPLFLVDAEAAAICATDSFGAHRSSSFDKILVVKVVVVVVVFECCSCSCSCSCRRRPPSSPRADEVDAEVDAKARIASRRDDVDDDVVT